MGDEGYYLYILTDIASNRDYGSTLLPLSCCARISCKGLWILQAVKITFTGRQIGPDVPQHPLTSHQEKCLLPLLFRPNRLSGTR